MEIITLSMVVVVGGGGVCFFVSFPAAVACIRLISHHFTFDDYLHDLFWAILLF